MHEPNKQAPKRVRLDQRKKGVGGEDAGTTTDATTTVADVVAVR